MPAAASTPLNTERPLPPYLQLPLGGSPDGELLGPDDYRRDDWGPRTPPTANGMAGHSGSPDTDGPDADKPQVSTSGSWTARFPGFCEQLDEAIRALGGKVVPKLNWSAPTDALWVSPSSSLQCSNSEQVTTCALARRACHSCVRAGPCAALAPLITKRAAYPPQVVLLLKSSDRIAHDVSLLTASSSSVRKAPSAAAQC